MDKNALIRALRDTAQSASNAIASNISGPVDLIAAGLRAGGLPVNNPVGGSQWMAEKGLTRDVEMGVPRIVGETLGMAGPAVVAAKAPQIAGALNKGAANLAAPRTMNPQTGAIVWHGSPHKFDKFDASKIGTGEGAQAYGHGIYTAEARDVADQYRINLAYDPDQMRVGGKQINDYYNQIQNSAARMPAKVAQPEYEKLELLERLMANDPLDEVAGAASGMSKTTQDWFAKQVKPQFQTFGNLYKIDLPDEHIAKMLDWDKPLSQQSNQVQAFFSDHPRPPGPDTTLGEWLKPRIAEGSMIEQDLAQAGIPGIRYLDGFSRNSGGTSNFVVFPGNENILQILERNGQPLGLMGVR